MAASNSLVLLLFLSAGFVARDSNAEKLDSSVAIGSSAHVWSRVLQEDRRVFVSTPASYSKTQWQYPVMYVLDAETQFVNAAAMTRYMAQNDRIPEMIVISVANENRNQDMAPGLPYRRSNGQALDGRAHLFLKFLTEELRPWIATRYRSNGYSLLVGHSDGGLFVLSTLLSRPDSFQAYFAFSPSHGPQMVEPIAAAIGALESPHFVFFSAADHEPRIRPATESLQQALRKLPHPVIEWAYRYYPGENHRSSVHPALYDGLNVLFAGFFPADLLLQNEQAVGLDSASLEQHYRQLSQKLGVALRVPEDALENSARFFEEHHDSAARMAICRTWVRLYPFSAQAQFTLGETLEASRQTVPALAAYEEGVRLSADNEDPYNALPGFRQKIEQLRGEQR
jgi:predicted alpha/beta superfamily hydrolase